MTPVLLVFTIASGSDPWFSFALLLHTGGGTMGKLRRVHYHWVQTVRHIAVAVRRIFMEVQFP